MPRSRSTSGTWSRSPTRWSPRFGNASPAILLGRRGTVADPVWVNRRLLLTAAEHLSAKQWKRLGRMLDEHDPTNEIGAAWGVKERLRMLLVEREPSKIRWRLADFYDAAIDARLPEATRLAETIQTWWPAILVALTEDASNARTEGFNRIIKQTKRVRWGRPPAVPPRRPAATGGGGAGSHRWRGWRPALCLPLPRREPRRAAPSPPPAAGGPGCGGPPGFLRPGRWPPRALAFCCSVHTRKEDAARPRRSVAVRPIGVRPAGKRT